MVGILNILELNLAKFNMVWSFYFYMKFHLRYIRGKGFDTVYNSDVIVFLYGVVVGNRCQRPLKGM